MLHYALPGHDPDRTREGFSAIDIDLPTDKANVADIRLSHRYPASGCALNTISEMIVLVREGEVVFHCEDEEIRLPEGSTILVETNRPYFWEPQPSVRLHVVSTPPWTPEQHRSV